MEGSIIHYDYGTFVKRRQELIREPEFKKTAVHCSAILKWRTDPVCREPRKDCVKENKGHPFSQEWGQEKA